jgi:tetratricopeptide (TPR) repeat protein
MQVLPMSLFFDTPIADLKREVQEYPSQILPRIALIQKLALHNQLHEALEEISVSEVLFPSNLELQAAKSLCMFAMGDTLEGYELMQQSLRRSPGGEIVQTLTDDLLPCFSNMVPQELFDPRVLRRSLSRDCTDKDVIDRLESTIELLETFTKSDDDPMRLLVTLEEHIRRFPDDVGAKLDLARLLCSMDLPKRAEKLYLQVLASDPLCAAAYFELATLEEDRVRAIELSRLGLEMVPQYECGRFNLGILLLQNGDAEQGRHELLRLPADSKFYIAALESIAGSFAEEGEVEKALEFQTKVVSLAKESVDAWNNFGHYHALLDDHETALVKFEEAIRLDGRNVIALHNKGLVLGRLGQHERAVEVLRHAFNIAPDNEAIISALGFELGNMDRYEEAIELTELAIIGNDDNARMWLNLGNYYSKVERLEDSLRCSHKALEIDSEKAAAIWNIACVHAKQNDKENCLLFLAQAIKKDPAFAKRIRHEADLVTFRKDPKFIQLAEELGCENGNQLDDRHQG